jgi:hypothetical protein
MAACTWAKGSAAFVTVRIAATSLLLGGVSADLAADAENSFSARKPDKMRALSATHT